VAFLRLKYVHAFVDKTGKTRFYFRYRGERWPLPGLPGTVDFAKRYDELRAAHVTPRATSDTLAFAPGTLGWAIEKWLGSKEYKSKATNTQVRYRRVADLLREHYGRGLLSDLQERHVRVMRSNFMRSTSSADLVLVLISSIWIFAKEVLALDLGPNPTRDIRKVHKKTYEHEPWPATVLDAFEANAKPAATMRLALFLLLFTGQRLGDVAAMRWSQYDGTGIAVRQQKTGELLWIPCHHRLQAALAETERRSDFILTTQFGRRYSMGSLSNALAWNTAAVGAKGFSAHGLRKNAGIALAEAGCTDMQIMAVLGHRTYVQAHAYTRRAQQRILATQAIEMRERAEKMANPRTKQASFSGKPFDS
jgi:integrase